MILYIVTEYCDITDKRYSWRGVSGKSLKDMLFYKINEDLPFINHPVVQAGSNFVTANNEVAPKQRGLMLKRGQALYVAASGATALTTGFYCNIQGGLY